MGKKFNSVDEYIASFPAETQDRLQTIRELIIKNAPEAIENIGYGMPAYKYHKKPLVYFAGYKTHIGFYATPTGHDEFKEQLSGYKQGKGSVQFPLNEKLPIELIADIVRFRVKENENKK